MLALMLLPAGRAWAADAEPVTPRHARGLWHASSGPRRAGREARQTAQGALGRRLAARPEAAGGRHQARRDPRQGLERRRRCRLRHGELLGGQASRRGAVLGLPLRPRRQGSISIGSRTATAGSSTRRCTTMPGSRSTSCLAPSAAPKPAAGSPRRSRPRTTSRACACAFSGSAAGSCRGSAPSPCWCRAAICSPPSTRGKIDAAELYPPAVDERQGLKDKIKLIYVPGWHQPETVLELHHQQGSLGRAVGSSARPDRRARVSPRCKRR